MNLRAHACSSSPLKPASSIQPFGTALSISSAASITLATAVVTKRARLVQIITSSACVSEQTFLAQSVRRARSSSEAKS